MHQSSPHHHATTMTEAQRERKRKRSARVACSDCSAASPKRIWLKPTASRLRSQGRRMKKKANAAEGSIGRIVGRHTAVQTTTIIAPQFRPAVVARRGVVALREEKATGGILMTKRYIVLLMCDSTVTTNVIKMNVDVVFIGSFTPPQLLAFACR
jgi:hypothetical protein